MAKRRLRIPPQATPKKSSTALDNRRHHRPHRTISNSPNSMIPQGHPSTWETSSPAPFHDWQTLIQFVKALKASNDDAMILMDGREGAGKSSLAFQLAKALDKTWHPDEGVIIDYTDWLNLYDLQRGKIFLLDEGGDLLFSRDAMTKEAKNLVKIFQMSRIYNHTLICLAPNLHWLDPYIRQHRGIIYVQVHKEYHLTGTRRGKATVYWSKRFFHRNDGEWRQSWTKVFDLTFEAVADLKAWREYEQIKLAKIEQRQTDLILKR